MEARTAFTLYSSSIMVALIAHHDGHDIEIYRTDVQQLGSFEELISLLTSYTPTVACFYMHRNRQHDDEGLHLREMRRYFSYHLTSLHPFDANVYYLPMRLFLLAFPFTLNFEGRRDISFSCISSSFIYQK